MAITVDPTYYAINPKFGSAGGPDVVSLSDAGRAAAFTVANQMKVTAGEMRRLEIIRAHGDDGALGVFDAYLRDRECIMHHAGRSFMTERGYACMKRADEEQESLLVRINAEMES